MINLKRFILVFALLFMPETIMAQEIFLPHKSNADVVYVESCPGANNSFVESILSQARELATKNGYKEFADFKWINSSKPIAVTTSFDEIIITCGFVHHIAGSTSVLTGTIVHEMAHGFMRHEELRRKIRSENCINVAIFARCDWKKIQEGYDDLELQAESFVNLFFSKFEPKDSGYTVDIAEYIAFILENIEAAISSEIAPETPQNDKRDKRLVYWQSFHAENTAP